MALNLRKCWSGNGRKENRVEGKKKSFPTFTWGTPFLCWLNHQQIVIKISTLDIDLVDDSEAMGVI